MEAAMALQEQNNSNDPLARIRSEARRIITTPELAAETSASGRRIAWLIEASARGVCLPQRHRGPCTGSR